MWCRTRYDLSQWWPSALTHIHVTRPQVQNAHCSLRRQVVSKDIIDHAGWTDACLARGRATHASVKQAIVGSDNCLSPERRQAIIWTNAGILLIGTLGTKFSQILSEVHTFSFKKMQLKMPTAKWGQFCLGLNVLTTCTISVLINYRIFQCYFYVGFLINALW